MSEKWLAFAICTMLLFIKCRTKDSNPIEPFANKQEQIISGEEIPLASDTILFRPFNFQVYDSLAVICDNTGATGYSVINLGNGQLVKKFAFSGNEPAEFDVNALSMNGCIHDSSTFIVTQINPPNKVFLFKWDSLLHKTVYSPEPFFYPKQFGYNNAVLLNDSMLLGRFSYSKFDNKMFGIVNMASNKLITGIEVPGINDRGANRKYEDSPYYRWMNFVLEDNFIYRPGGNDEFACFSFRGAAIKIFRIDEHYHFVTKFEKTYYFPAFYIVDMGGGAMKPRTYPYCKNGFTSITATKDKIYALYNGPLLDNSQPNHDTSNVVLVYDWDGNPLERIKLDKKCSRIAVDHNNSQLLYGLHGASNSAIVRYRLPLN